MLPRAAGARPGRGTARAQRPVVHRSARRARSPRRRADDRAAPRTRPRSPAPRRAGRGLALRGDRGHRLAVEAHPVDRDDRAVPDRVAPVGIDVGESAPVSTQTTPGIASAARVSIETMRACGDRAAQHLAVQHPRQHDVAHELRPRRAASRARPGAAPSGRPAARRSGSRSSVLTPSTPAMLADGLEDAPVARAAAEVAARARGGSPRSSPSSPAASSDAMVSSIPPVQKPHCTAAWRVNASSSGTNSRLLAQPLDRQHVAPVGVARRACSRR